MAKKKKRRWRDRPPCPDPDRYYWVETSEGGYWRRYPEHSTLNSVLRLSADSTRPTNEAAKRVMQKLHSFVQHLMTGRTTMRIAGAFKKAILARGQMDYDFLRDFDFQAYHYPFEKLVKWGVFVKEEKGLLYVTLPQSQLSVRRHSVLATGFYAELILLFGDPGNDKTLRVDSTVSDNYSFLDKEPTRDCELSIQLPERQPWMAILKVSCLGKEVATAAKYQAMKVVRVGNGVS